MPGGLIAPPLGAANPFIGRKRESLKVGGLAGVGLRAIVAVLVVALLAAAPQPAGATGTFVSVQCPAFSPPQGIVANVTAGVGGAPYSCSLPLLQLAVTEPNGTIVQLSPASCNSTLGLLRYPAFQPGSAGNFNLTVTAGFASGFCVTTKVYWKPAQAASNVPELPIPAAAAAAGLGVLAFGRRRLGKGAARGGRAG